MGAGGEGPKCTEGLFSLEVLEAEGCLRLLAVGLGLRCKIVVTWAPGKAGLFGSRFEGHILRNPGLMVGLGWWLLSVLLEMGRGYHLPATPQPCNPQVETVGSLSSTTLCKNA